MSKSLCGSEVTQKINTRKSRGTCPSALAGDASGRVDFLISQTKRVQLSA